MPYYRVSLQHNDSYAFRGDPALTDNQRIHQELVPDMSGEVRSEPRRCAVCGALTSKWNEPLSELVIKKRTFDLSITYDGVLIASQRLKSIYDRNDLSGLVFRPLPHDPMFLAVYASRLVEFDFTRRNTRFIAHCSQCGQYESVEMAPV
jgi:hypothetical protein